MKKCPFCAEEIQDAAIVCKHCKRELGTQQKKDTIPCPFCKALVPRNSGVCPACGDDISGVTGDPPRQAATSALKRQRRVNPVVGLLALVVVGIGVLTLMRGSTSVSGPTPSPPSTAQNVPAQTAVPPPVPKPAVPPAGGKWTQAQDTSAMDDSKGVSFYLEAENEIAGWLKRKTPGLVVRCKEKNTNVYMVTGMPASVESEDLERHTVRVRFDDAQAQRQHWSQSTDNEALFAPNPTQMARNIAKAKTLRLEFTPFNASPVIATFDVSGFAQHIGKMAAACGWKP